MFGETRGGAYVSAGRRVPCGKIRSRKREPSCGRRWEAGSGSSVRLGAWFGAALGLANPSDRAVLACTRSPCMCRAVFFRSQRPRRKHQRAPPPRTYVARAPNSATRRCIGGNGHRATSRVGGENQRSAWPKCPNPSPGHDVDVLALEPVPVIYAARTIGFRTKDDAMDSEGPRRTPDQPGDCELGGHESARAASHLAPVAGEAPLHTSPLGTSVSS